MANYEHISHEEKIEKAKKISDVAKQFFKKEKYNQSLSKYELAFKLLLPSLMDENDDVEKLKKEEIGVLSNICACKLKLESYRDVIEISTKVISDIKKIQLENDGKLSKELEKLKMKGFYRRGIAGYETNNYDLAVKSFVEAQEFNKGSKVFESYVKKSIEALERYFVREKKHYKTRLLSVLDKDKIK